MLKIQSLQLKRFCFALVLIVGLAAPVIGMADASLVNAERRC